MIRPLGIDTTNGKQVLLDTTSSTTKTFTTTSSTGETVVVSFTGTDNKVEYDVCASSGLNITNDSRLSRRWSGADYVLKMAGGWPADTWTLKPTICKIFTGGTGGTGSGDYDLLINRPQINSVVLTGNKSLSDFGIPTVTDQITQGSTEAVTSGAVYIALNGIDAALTTIMSAVDESSSSTESSSSSVLVNHILIVKNTGIVACRGTYQLTSGTYSTKSAIYTKTTSGVAYRVQWVSAESRWVLYGGSTAYYYTTSDNPYDATWLALSSAYSPVPIIFDWSDVVPWHNAVEVSGAGYDYCNGTYLADSTSGGRQTFKFLNVDYWSNPYTLKYTEVSGSNRWVIVETFGSYEYIKYVSSNSPYDPVEIQWESGTTSYPTVSDSITGDFLVTDAGSANINGSYTFSGGTVGTTSAIYTRNAGEMIDIEYNTNGNKWVFYDNGLVTHGYYKASSITGTWEMIEEESDSTGLYGIGDSPVPSVTYIE